MPSIRLLAALCAMSLCASITHAQSTPTAKVSNLVAFSISNPGITQYVVDGLAEGTWYFTLSSLNRSGVESRPTGVVAKAIS